MMHFDFLAVGLGKISEIILKYHISVVSELEDKSEFLFEFSKNNPLWLILYVIIFLAVVFMWKKNVKVGNYDADGSDDAAVSVNET